MTDDSKLLRKFADEGSDASFRELVAQRIDFVYAVALRQVGGDATLAEEVAQSVFFDLARKARSLARRTTITGWLYTSARFAAAKALRARARRLRHETEAHAMQEILSARAKETVDWNELRPVIDAVLHELDERDREAVLLRYFEGRSLTEVGAALGLAENSARMRVERAMEKLRVRLARRSITSTAAALAVALANQPAAIAPAGLDGVIAGAWQVGVRVGGATSTMMNALKLIAGMAVAGAVGIGGTYWTMQTQQEKRFAMVATRANSAAALGAENERLKSEVARLQAARTAAKDGATSPLTELRALVSASQQKLIGPMPSLLRTNNGQLQPAMSKLFNLSTEEKAVVEKELEETRLQVDALAVTNVLAVERPSPTRVVIHFRPYPEAGAKVHDRLVAELARTLGAERQAALLLLTGEQFDRVGNGFGAWERSVTFERRPSRPPDGQIPLYIVNDAIRFSKTTVGTSRSGDRAMIESEFASFAKMLPADF